MKKIRLLDGLIYLALLIIFLAVLFCGKIEYAGKRIFLINNVALLLVGLFIATLVYFFCIKRKNKLKLNGSHKKDFFFLAYHFHCTDYILLFSVFLYGLGCWGPSDSYCQEYCVTFKRTN